MESRITLSVSEVTCSISSSATHARQPVDAAESLAPIGCLPLRPRRPKLAEARWGARRDFLNALEREPFLPDTSVTTMPPVRSSQLGSPLLGVPRIAFAVADGQGTCQTPANAHLHQG
eukprot:762665-Hanusia_phi.AAC.2